MGFWAAPGVSKDTKPLNTALYGGRGELAHLVSIPSILDTLLPFMGVHGGRCGDLLNKISV